MSATFWCGVVAGTYAQAFACRVKARHATALMMAGRFAHPAPGEYPQVQ